MFLEQLYWTALVIQSDSCFYLESVKVLPYVHVQGR